MNFLYYRTLANVLNSRFVFAFYHDRIARLTEHDDVIKPLPRGALCLGPALCPAPARAGPGYKSQKENRFDDMFEQRSYVSA